MYVFIVLGSASSDDVRLDDNDGDGILKLDLGLSDTAVGRAESARFAGDDMVARWECTCIALSLDGDLFLCLVLGEEHGRRPS